MANIPSYPQTNTEKNQTSLVVMQIGLDDNSFEWGLSFGGHNPNPEDYFIMVDEETAMRLRDKLSNQYHSLHVLQAGIGKFDYEWGLSFQGNNPCPEDYFKMADEGIAFRLKERLLTSFPPIPFDVPVSNPIDK